MGTPPPPSVFPRFATVDAGATTVLAAISILASATTTWFWTAMSSVLHKALFVITYAATLHHCRRHLSLRFIRFRPRSPLRDHSRAALARTWVTTTEACMLLRRRSRRYVSGGSDHRVVPRRPMPHSAWPPGSRSLTPSATWFNAAHVTLIDPLPHSRPLFNASVAVVDGRTLRPRARPGAQSQDRDQLHPGGFHSDFGLPERHLRTLTPRLPLEHLPMML